ncbi:UbiA prenyltransferase family [Cryptosporidium tyzzeri]|nr:UbiA prenyltransferase family [Cryptosporidium tyzzeri]
MNTIRPNYGFINSSFPKTCLQSVFRTSRGICKMNFKHYIKLYRINNPTGFWLLFIPTFGSLALASNSLLPKANITALFALGSVASRSAGCVINDIADRQFDSKVERTKNRPLANGEMAFTKAIVLSRLNRYTIYLGIPSVFLIAAYPFMKRITHYPQLFLGFTFNWGVLLAWTSIYGCINPYRNSWLCPISYYLSSVCWSVHYDTIYAHQDRLFDKQIGLFSTALKWNEATGSHLFINAIVSGIFASSAGIFANLGFSVLLYTAHLIYQSKTTNFFSEQDCRKQFIMSKYSGVVLLLGIIFSKYKASKKHSNKDSNTLHKG